MDYGNSMMPPDGGYGWVITFAYALYNVVVMPVYTGFALIFKEAIHETGLSATEGNLIISLNRSIGNIIWIGGGPLLNWYGYRKVSVVAGLLISAGLFLTAFSSSFWLFFFSYNIVNALGIAAANSSFNLAITAFFDKKRGRAVGFGTSVTGLGFMFMPLLMGFLLDMYGWRSTTMIIGAICLHTLVAACLLRPIKLYLIPVPELNDKVTQDDTQSITIKSECDKIDASEESGFHQEEIEDHSYLATNSVRSFCSGSEIDGVNSITIDSPKKQNEQNNLDIHTKYICTDSFEKEKSKNVTDIKEGISKSRFQKIVDVFDLKLLLDGVFVNILFGLALSNAVERIFALLTPIILEDMFMMPTTGIAQFMVVSAISDTIFKILSPFIGEWLKKSPREMYMFSLILTVIIRSVILLPLSFVTLLILGFGFGLTKAFRMVYKDLVIPAYVPIDRFPCASSMYNGFNGIVVLATGSIFGYIRDFTGSYYIPIHVLNVLTLVPVATWGTEMVYTAIKQKRLMRSQDTVSV